jgi:hypothetical protein
VYFHTGVAVLRVVFLSLRRVPPPISFCDESSPKLALIPARSRRVSKGLAGASKREGIELKGDLLYTSYKVNTYLLASFN